jgi:hypothetical protein
MKAAIEAHEAIRTSSRPSRRKAFYRKGHKDNAKVRKENHFPQGYFRCP